MREKDIPFDFPRLTMSTVRVSKDISSNGMLTYIGGERKEEGRKAYIDACRRKYEKRKGN